MKREEIKALESTEMAIEDEERKLSQNVSKRELNFQYVEYII